MAWAETLLDRQGVVTRPGVAAEGLPGGFSALYPALTRLEETGRARRGYFVEGLGGAQFARAGAVDRLRSAPGGVVTVAAADPANPYGAALPWPESGRLARLPGAYVVLVDGALAAYSDGRRLVVIDKTEELRAPIAVELAELGARLRRFRVDTIDGAPAAGPWEATLLAAGFVPSPRGLVHPGPRRRDQGRRTGSATGS